MSERPAVQPGALQRQPHLEKGADHRERIGHRWRRLRGNGAPLDYARYLKVFVQSHVVSPLKTRASSHKFASIKDCSVLLPPSIITDCMSFLYKISQIEEIR